MTISSSLNAGVSGLNANATRLSAISDNIANSGTAGYKRMDTDFAALVMSEAGAGSYSAGGVRTATTRLIDERGPIIATANATDLAVSGRGFLPVTSWTSVTSGDETPMMLTTTGSFRMDKDGYLATPSGLVLMGWPADAEGNIPSFSRDTLGGLAPVNVKTNQYVGNPTTTMSLGLNLPATATVAGADGAPRETTVEYYGNLGTAESLHLTFTPTVPATGASNEWTLQITDSASGNAVIGEYTLTFNSGATNGGTLASVTQVSGGAYDAATGALALTTANGPLALGIGLPGTVGGLSQLTDTFSPASVSRNGAPIGNFSSVEVTDSGLVKAIYDNGFSRTIYQVPVADVANPNGLTSLDSQTYQVSSKSGGFFLWDAGDGPTGAVAAFAQEESATDVATELTSLIQTQRAYSSNAKVIQTVDEMLQETTNMKR